MKVQVCLLVLVACVAHSSAFYGRRPARTTRDPWPAETPTTRRSTTTTPPTTTTPETPRGRELCRDLSANGDCTFYVCFFNTQQVCRLGDSPAFEALASVCIQSEEVQDQNQFDFRGNRYILNYRKCTQKRLLQVVDSRRCSQIDAKAEEILLTEDIIWDCLYQNHTLCDVIENSDNSVGLASIFQNIMSYEEYNMKIFQHLLRRVNSQCGATAGRLFSNDFGQTYLSNMQSMMPGMMMSGNGGDRK
ncbi:uncharacterized protein LOC124135028 [Haliotis rufescens]|uniref:uncharacterized protein LOC124135028 n=1 Tax=Haliotis rufescens TaxID=6454 RepID=UPI00201F0214|nr:uncharacterized protein LOC124135028 [Haliotis rufescens]